MTYIGVRHAHHIDFDAVVAVWEGAGNVVVS